MVWDQNNYRAIYMFLKKVIRLQKEMYFFSFKSYILRKTERKAFASEK